MKATSILIFLVLLAAAIVGALLVTDPAEAPTPQIVDQPESTPPEPQEEPQEEPEIVGPKGISKKVYREWREPRFGEWNGQPLTNPVWQWLIEEKPEPSAADTLFRLRDTDSLGPAWTFNRVGASETALPNGQILWAGGRHGEPGDPNYYVYNDLVVKKPEGEFSVLGYPEAIFPPIHSHSATLVSNYILLIGGLGGPESEPSETTRIQAIRIEKFGLHPWSGVGPGPGAIYGHTAKLSDNKLWIEVSGGFIQSPDGSSTPNSKRWRLDLDTLYWTELADNLEAETQ